MTLSQEREHALRDLGPDRGRMCVEVMQGLSRNPKQLPSHYLYDERGARLFEKICETEDYYPTRTEIGILVENMDAISGVIGPGAMVIEPGSGSGVKTRLLLENLEAPAAYVPIDVSRKQLRQVARELRREFPDLEVAPVCADFTDTVVIPECAAREEKRLMFFPGSTIGNFEPDDAAALLKQMSTVCGEEGNILMGVDLKKDRETLEAAYDDAEGYSREFALNILERLNREIGANFKVDQFEYQAPYNEEEGRIEMAVVSRCRQAVTIGPHRVEIEAGEPVGTEYSYKYGEEDLARLASRAGLSIMELWTDANRYFSVTCLSAA